MKNYKSLIAIAIFIAAFAFSASAQGGGFLQYFIPAGSNSAGYPIVTATVPQGTRVGYWGRSGFTDSLGIDHHTASILYFPPQTTEILPLENHLLIAGRCDGFQIPSGYKRVQRYRGIYGLDDPDLGGTFDWSIEYCLLEIALK